MVGDVVPVPRPRSCFEHRRQVDVRNAETGEVLRDLTRLGEPEVRGELQPVSRDRHPARRHIPPIISRFFMALPSNWVSMRIAGNCPGAPLQGPAAGAAAAAHYDG